MFCSYQLYVLVLSALSLLNFSALLLNGESWVPLQIFFVERTA